jgi:hypothetical protein
LTLSVAAGSAGSWLAHDELIVVVGADQRVFGGRADEPATIGPSFWTNSNCRRGAPSEGEHDAAVGAVYEFGNFSHYESASCFSHYEAAGLTVKACWLMSWVARS